MLNVKPQQVGHLSNYTNLHIPPALIAPNLQKVVRNSRTLDDMVQV